MRHIAILILLLILPFASFAQNVTIKAVNQPAAVVFRSILEQTGKNFVYSSDLLKNMTITVNANKQPLKKVLSNIFKNTDIEYTIKGNNVILKKKKEKRKNITVAPATPPKIKTAITTIDTVKMLDEIIVLSRLEAPAVETSEMGARKITVEELSNVPMVFGESDVIKALQMQPGVSDGTEGMAGMHVHGGNSDENLFSLDNVPLYQVNHFLGLFSAFNTDIIRYIDFFKTSVPAKYDGRLSSFMDVRLRNGYTKGHHGSAKLGLTSGAFNISGPMGKNTTYLAGLRRSWYDVLSIPILAIANSQHEEEKIRFRYAFMDFNAKVTHRFSSKMTGFISGYYGNDLLKTGTEDSKQYSTNWYGFDKFDLTWGNLVVQAGLNYRINPKLSGEFTAAYTRYFSNMKYKSIYNEDSNDITTTTQIRNKTDNNINDWIFRGDFDWTLSDNSQVRFGANYIRHSFLPERTKKEYRFNDETISSRDSTTSYGGNELNAYIEDDWQISGRFRANAGLHGSLFYLQGKTHGGISPRLSLSFRLNNNFTVKGAYTHTIQYVHQLAMTYLSLPTDQWIPITGKFKPQTADKVALGGYWQSDNEAFAVSVEGYLKRIHNLVDYRDEYYLKPPLDFWEARLTSGKGSAKGVDVMIEKKTGKLTGHIGYSLAWVDRQFKDKNGGLPYPARFDNRHTINVVVNWNVNDKVTLNAAWTGHSGNRYTLLPQMWEGAEFGQLYNSVDDVPLKAKVNNYQLPFYHRLDLACNVKNKHGFWTFSLYNAYNHMNTVAVVRGEKEVVKYKPGEIIHTYQPRFQKLKLIPIIPSISYTWQF